MLQSAVMCKIVHPASELYEIRAISDADIQEANDRFTKEGAPYRVLRPLKDAIKHQAA